MPKLYYTPTSCGAGCFITARASGLNFEAEQVNLGTHTTAVGNVDFYTINPKGNVPCIVLDDGSVLNENIACLTYLASLVSVYCFFFFASFFSVVRIVHIVVYLF